MIVQVTYYWPRAKCYLSVIQEILTLKARLSEASSRLDEANSKLAERDAASANVSLIDLDPAELTANLSSPMPSDTKEVTITDHP